MQLDMLATLKPRFYPVESVHQKRIEEHFGERLTRPWSDRERQMLGGLDLYFVVFTNRSGSTYLTEILHQMGAGVHPRAEIFNHDRLVAAAREKEYGTFTDFFLDMVRDNQRNGKIGFKISIHQLFWATRHGLLQPFRSVKIINSLRQDVLGQAVSHYKARATGQWHSLMPARNEQPVPYVREEILLSLHVISHRGGLLDYYCSLHQPSRLDMVYESLLADAPGEIRRLADFLQLADFDPGQVDVTGIGIQQQRNEENEVLRQAFIDEFYMQSAGSHADSV